LGTVVFGDGSVNAAQAAEADLASPTFQGCWARTTDTLSAGQGLVVPVRPSTVQELPSPGLASRSAAFAVNSRYSVLGSDINYQLAVTVMQEGTFTVMLIGVSFGGPFPSAAKLGAATRIASRMGTSGSPAPAEASSCSFDRLPQPGVPVLSTAQVISDFHQKVTLASVVPGTSISCYWHGAPTTGEQVGPYDQYKVQLWLDLQVLPTQADARAAFKAARQADGPPTAVPGLGANVYVMPGQDEVTQALDALCGVDVFTLSLNSRSATKAQDEELVDAAKQVLARLPGC
jgi:hypothetical protein